MVCRWAEGSVSTEALIRKNHEGRLVNTKLQPWL